MRGVDISAYQGTVDFDALAAALPGGFVIAKATEGTAFIDAQFARNWTEAKRVALTRGAYHFAVPDLGSSAQDEARHFLSILGPLDASVILALDYERDWTGDVVGWCREWLELVRSFTGITPYQYLNRSLVAAHDWTPVIVAGFPLWLAAYDGQPDTVIETPWPRVAIKQYTSAGTIAGISGLVDLNSMEEADMDQRTFDKMALDWWSRPATSGGAEGPQSFEAVKAVLAQQQVKLHILETADAAVPDAIAGRVIQRLGQLLFLRQPDKPAGVPANAAFFSESDDFSIVGWSYDGRVHFFQNGTEITPAPTPPFAQ